MVIQGIRPHSTIIHQKGRPAILAGLLAILIVWLASLSEPNGCHSSAVASDAAQRARHTTQALEPIGGPFQPDAPAMGQLPATPEAAVPDDWYAAITKDIAASEYHIRWQEEAGAYQSPNRKQDLRITYRADGFSLKPRVADSLWSVSLTLDRIGRLEQWYLPSNSATITAQDAHLLADHGAFAVEYLNTEEGMRQNFIVRERPAGKGPLEVLLDYQGTLHAADKGGNAIAFCTPVAGTSGYTPTLWYKDLHVWDAHGDTLDATATLMGDAIVLAVNDADATYPITVDPLSTTAAWSAESDQASAHFGTSVGSAGDVNGDGYSEVIIGAPDFDNGQTNEGRAYLFHGSATGPSATAIWTFESDLASAQLGISVSTAGDVNGDGFSDVIIGASGYANGQSNEGRIYVFRGSTTGLPTTPAWTFESDVSLARLGFSVACAGDVNNDGFSDVIAGAYDLSNGQTNEGRAYVFHGTASGLPAVPSWTYESNQTSARLGRSVAGAGDVNGDGFSDVIIGVHNWDNGQSNEGRALVFHGSGTGLSATPNWTEEIDLADAWFGYCVASAGDVNGDGYSDVIVGSYQYNNGLVAEGAAFVYHGSAAGLAATHAWLREGEQASAHFGEAVACAGDINGDGFADILVGAPDFDQTYTDGGLVQLWLGSPTGAASTPYWTSEGYNATAGFGSSVACAGDVNGDGYSDVLIGAPGYSGGQAQEGNASMYIGTADGLEPTPGWVSATIQANSYFGWATAGAGDVNGDGFSDVLIGAALYDNGQGDEGAAFCFHGSATGLGSTWSWFTESDQGFAQFGRSVAGAGDVNGDGYSDVIVGASLYDNGQADEGRAYFFVGGSTGIASTPAAILEQDQANRQFGTCVASAGDVNADGYSDVLVGSMTGAVAYYGSASGLPAAPNWIRLGYSLGMSLATAGDVNGDGYSDVVCGMPYNHPDEPGSYHGLALIFHGSSAGLGATFNWSFDPHSGVALIGCSVASAGDVNGDGYSDVLVGGEGDQLASVLSLSNLGRAWLFYGGPSGLAATAAWTANGGSETLRYGSCVAGLGDVNGDGYSDFAVGTRNSGLIRVFLGNPSVPSTTASWTTTGAPINIMGYASLAGSGDVNGDGYSDLAISYVSVPTASERVFHGNNATGRHNNLRLYNTNLTAPISQSNIAASNQFGAGLYAKPFLGRGRVRMVWETRYQGQAFSSAGGRITNSTAYTAQQAAHTLTAVAGTEMKDLVTKLTSTNPITATKVRARLRYSLATAITGQLFGPWRYMPGYLDGHGTHNNIPLPVEMLWMEAACDKDTPLLTWATGSESSNAYFAVERSTNAETWERVGQVNSTGNSQQVTEYAWRDERPLFASVVYYRLRQVDVDGREEVLAVLPLASCHNNFTELSVMPNPTDGPIEVRWVADGKAGIAELLLVDTRGRTLRVERIAPDATRAEMDLAGIAAGTYTLLGLDAQGVQVGSARVLRR